MLFATRGLHHITAVASDTDTNVAFYTGVLGLRLVKQTVNFDDKKSYHFYYGNVTGSPGTLLTFFIGLAPKPVRASTARVTEVRLAVPEGSLGYWMDRLAFHRVVYRHNDQANGGGLSFVDPDGLPLQLVPSRRIPASVTARAVRDKDAIVDLHGVAIATPHPEPTAIFLAERLGLRLDSSCRDGMRLTAGVGSGHIVDVKVGLTAPAPTAIGQVHHLAFRAEDEREQLAWRAWSCEEGVEVTPVIDRKYFRSIYFHDPAGMRLEIATDGPGFVVDEPASTLGRRLQLPEALESRRLEFESALKTGHRSPTN